MNKKNAIRQLESLERYLELIVKKNNNGFISEDIDAIKYALKVIKK